MAATVNRLDCTSRESFTLISRRLHPVAASMRWLLQEDGVPKPGFTIFLLFFGVAMLDALQGGSWPRVAFWAGMGAAFWAIESWGIARQRGR